MPESGRNAHRTSTRGFTLVEVLVALGIVALLVGILVPALSGAREQARRVVCASNQRQAGLGLHMFADQNRGYLPASRFLPMDHTTPARPQDMVIVRVEDRAPKSSRFRTLNTQPWDGLGQLFKGEYLPAPVVYYCPSHPGEVRMEAFEDRWHDAPGEIISNYHYRGEGPNGERKLAMMPSSAALVSDSLRSVEELNHEGGFNVLKTDLAVNWVLDSSNVVADVLSRTSMSAGGSEDENETNANLWRALDSGSATSAGIPPALGPTPGGN